MKEGKSKDAAEIKRLVGLYNLFINLVWSIPVFVLVTVFCYRFLPTWLVIAYLLPPMLSLFLPNSIFDQMHAGGTTAFYKRMGVVLINRFSQNGTIIQKLVRKRYPDFKFVRHTGSSIKQLLSQSYLFEKFHFAAAVFFTFLTLHCVITDRGGWAVVFFVVNVVYNVYPILFQQYVRLKLKAFTKRNLSKSLMSSPASSCRLLLRHTR